MNEQYGDMFEEYLSPEVLYVIPTNGYIKNDMTNVMGRGVAKDAAFLQKKLPSILGDLILAWGNRCYLLPGNMVSCPTKDHWKERSDIELIGRSLGQLRDLWITLDRPRLYLPRIGCGNGGLSWYHVRPLVANTFGDDDRVTVWEINEPEDWDK